MALDLEIHLCRSRQRLVFQRERDGDQTARTNVQSAGAAAAAWLLVRDTLEFMKGVPGLTPPMNQELAKLIEVTPSVFGGNLLKGWPGKKDGSRWTKKARTVFRYLLIGRDETPRDDPQEGVARRIHEFFFRELDKKPVPPFFERERLPFGEPCSITEIRDEISWLIRKFERTKRAARLVWVSGGTSLFAEDTKGYYAAVVADALRAGIEVSFVYSSNATNPAAKKCLDEFVELCGPLTERQSERLYDVATRYSGDEKAPANLREFLHPSLRHLYLSIPDGNGGGDDTLFILRAPFDKDEQRRLPLALEANDAELADFQLWLNRVWDTTPVPESQMKKKPGGTN